jgi:hypothetical protein
MTEIKEKSQVEVDELVIIHKNTKVIHKVFSKMKTLILTTQGLIDEHNVGLILTQVMRELNKHDLFGFEKKRLAIEIMILLLDATGSPHVINKFTIEMLVELIELVYCHGMHRYKKTGKCLIL